MVTNICVIGLLKNHIKDVAKRVADALEMFYADLEELLTFDLIDVINAQKIVGKEYIEKQETKKIKTLASYENTVITLSYLSLNNEENLKSIKNGCLVVLINFEKDDFFNKIKTEKLNKQEKELQQKMFNERQKVLQGYSDIIVDGGGTVEEVFNKTIKSIGEYYEKR